MTDNDDYMAAKAYDDTIIEQMWDRLQEGVNANRRFRIKGVAGGDDMEYDTTKVVWSSDIYIYFTKESDGSWVYNKINANATTGITCGDNDLLYVVLNDTTTTVLTVTAADYSAMPTDDTGRILILGAVSNSTWYGNVVGGNIITHNTSHQNGGSDEIDVVDLSGLLADPQLPLLGNLKIIDEDRSATANAETKAFWCDPFNTQVTVYEKGTPSIQYRCELEWFAPEAGGGKNMSWFFFCNTSAAGLGKGYQFDFTPDTSDDYTADFYVYSNNNTGTYWHFRVDLDTTNKYSAQPTEDTFNKVSVALGTLTASTTYTLKFYQYCNSVVSGSHSATYYVHAINIRAT